MKEKKFLIVGLLSILVFAAGCLSIYKLNKKEEAKTPTSDALKFKEEYKKVDDDNLFVYRDMEEIIKILENGTGVVYLGFPECPWCQAYVPYLNEVAKEVGLDKIYYANTKKIKEENLDVVKVRRLVAEEGAKLAKNTAYRKQVLVCGGTDGL